MTDFYLSTHLRLDRLVVTAETDGDGHRVLVISDSADRIRVAMEPETARLCAALILDVLEGDAARFSNAERR